MGNDVSANIEAVYRACCGESENTETRDDIINESKSNGETPHDNFDFIDDEHKGLLSKTSNEALDSFLKHQFSDLTPEIIRSQGLDPIHEVWTTESQGILFKINIKLGPLIGLSQLVYDELDADDVEIKYNETLHLYTNIAFNIKIRDGEALTLGLDASLSLDPRGTDVDSIVGVPIKGKVRVEGLRLKCMIALHHSLDLEWNERDKSIEGTFQNDLRLSKDAHNNDISITYENIAVEFTRSNFGDLTPTLWIQIEEKIGSAVMDLFKKQIEKLLTKMVRNEIEKVLNQINHKVPRFEIEFDKVEETEGDTSDQKESTSSHVDVDERGEKEKDTFNLFRRFKM